jgi:hypothetical protein
MKFSEECSNHRRKSLFYRLSYVERSIEAERRLKAGWKQRPCKKCKRMIWIDPTQARSERPKKRFSTTALFARRHDNRLSP